MASIHNALRRLAEVQRAAKIGFGLDAEGGGLERLGETLTVVADLWTLPEWAALRGERLMRQQVIAAAVAGQPSGVGVSNPAASGVLCVVERFVWRNDAAAAAAFDVYQNGTVGVLSSGVQLDQRLGTGDTRGTVRLYTRSGVAPDGTIQERYTCPAGDVKLIEGPWVLGPGHRIAVFGETLNAAATVTFSWRERVALPGELQL